jgi:hypothetical protein
VIQRFNSRLESPGPADDRTTHMFHSTARLDPFTPLQVYYPRSENYAMGGNPTFELTVFKLR